MPALIDAHHLGLGQTGNETWVRNIVSALVREGDDETHVAVSHAGWSHLPRSLADGRVHEVSGSSLKRLAVDLPLVLRRVHASAFLVQYTLPPAVRVPGVVAVHDLSFEHPEARQWIPLPSLLRYRATIRASARRARRILVPTEWTRRDLLEKYDVPEHRVLVAGIAMDPMLAEALVRHPRPEPGSELVVLCVGTVLPRKNLEVVARAVADLRRQGLPVRLRLVGPVPRPGQALAQRIRGLLREGVELSGPVSLDHLAHAYRGADVLAFPSLFEGFGIPIIEAMAAGVPVVTSGATCLPEVAGAAALCAGPDSPEDWAEALSRVLTDRPLRAAMTTAGAVRSGEYSWSRSASVVRRALTEAAA